MKILNLKLLRVILEKYISLVAPYQPLLNPEDSFVNLYMFKELCQAPFGSMEKLNCMLAYYYRLKERVDEIRLRAENYPFYLERQKECKQLLKNCNLLLKLIEDVKFAKLIEHYSIKRKYANIIMKPTSFLDPINIGKYEEYTCYDRNIWNDFYTQYTKVSEISSPEKELKKLKKIRELFECYTNFEYDLQCNAETAKALSEFITSHEVDKVKDPGDLATWFRLIGLPLITIALLRKRNKLHIDDVMISKFVFGIKYPEK